MTGYNSIVTDFKRFSTDHEKFQAIENAVQKTIYEDISVLHSLKTPTLQVGKSHLRNPIKVYPENANLIFAAYLLPQLEDAVKGKVRETFILNQLQNSDRKVFYSKFGDMMIDGMTFEMGGKNKNNAQLKEVKQGYIVSDDLLIGSGHKIPLYLFGLLY